MEKKLSIKQNMIYNSIGSFVYLICQWLITIIVVRISDYENAGVLSLAISVNNIFFTISTFGLKHYQVSDIENKYSDLEYIATRWITCFGGLMCCVMFIVLNSSHYDMRQMSCIFIYFLFKAIEAFIDVFQGIQQKNYRMDYVGISYIVRGILTLISFTIVVKVTQKLAFGIAAMAVVSLVVAIAFDYRICAKLMKTAKDMVYKKITALIKENIALMANAVFMTGFVSIARFFLELYVGEEVLGIYASIATPTVIIQTACGMIYSPLVTEYAVYYNQKAKDKFVNLIKKVMIAFIAILVICLIGVYVFGDFGLALLFGEDILKYSYLLSQTIIVTFLVAFVYWLSAILVVERKQKEVMVVNGIGIIIDIIASMCFIPIYKIDGINMALFVALIMDIIMLVFVVYRATKKHFN